MKLTQEQIEQALNSLRGLAGGMAPIMQNYLDYNWRRYVVLVRFTERALGELDVPAHRCRLLDIGPSFQTYLFSRLWPEMRIDTLGFTDPKFPPPGKGQHFAYDLNSTDQAATWSRLEGYDLVVMAEVIEHLYTSPRHVFRFLDSILSAGGILVVTTPNAVALTKRLRVALGQNPNEIIRENRCEPGHFREYTIPELAQTGNAVGWRLVSTWSGHGTSTGSWKSKLYRSVSALLPASLRKDVALMFQKPVAPNPSRGPASPAA